MLRLQAMEQQHGMPHLSAARLVGTELDLDASFVPRTWLTIAGKATAAAQALEQPQCGAEMPEGFHPPGCQRSCAAEADAAKADASKKGASGSFSTTAVAAAL